MLQKWRETLQFMLSSERKHQPHRSESHFMRNRTILKIIIIINQQDLPKFMKAEGRTDLQQGQQNKTKKEKKDSTSAWAPGSDFIVQL